MIHCETEMQAYAIKVALADRLAACGLEMHPDVNGGDKLCQIAA